MELLNEMECNPINDTIKEEQSTVLEENKQKLTSKKKFYNTVFATKMRNRRKEEKLEKLETNEVLTSCKSVSVDVTRLSSNVVPKIISSIEHKNRRKKKFQWKLGKTKKKKKIRDKNKIMMKVKLKDINKKNNMNENDVKTHTSESEEKMEKLNEIKLEPLVDKDIQRRKSMRHVTPMMFFDEKWDFETKPDNGPIPEEKFSCRRTELFIGKLNTREARILNIEKILREENKPISQNHNNLIDNHKKEILEKTEDNALITNESVSEINKYIEDYNSIKDCINKESNESIENNKNLEESNKEEDDKNEGADKSIVDTLKNTEEKVVIQESNNLSEKVIETKDNIQVEEAACRRTVPFVGKISRNTLPGLSERFTEIDFIKSDENTKSEFSTNMKIKSNSSSEDVGIKFNLSKDTNNIGSSNDLNTELNTSINNIKLQIDDVPKNENKLNSSIQSSVSLESSNETDVKENLCNVIKVDCLSNDPSLKLDEFSVSNDKDVCSCRRTEPFLGKNFSNCSRTLPFMYSVNKVKSSVTPDTRTLPNITNSLAETITDRLNSDESDQSSKHSNQNDTKSIPKLENQETELNNSLTDNTVKMKDSGISDALVQNGEWKFRRKRHKINLDNEHQEERPTKKYKIKSSLESKSLINKNSTAISVSPEGTICSLLSLNCTMHAHKHLHNNECYIRHKEIIRDVFVLLTKLEYINDPLVTEYFKKTDYTNNIKQNSFPSKKDKIDSDKTSTSLNSQTRSVSRENDNEQIAKDDISNINVPELYTDTNSGNVHIENIKKDQDKIQSEIDGNDNSPLMVPRTRFKRRPFSRASSESPNVIHSKRKKGPVNYVENFSDSDTTESGSSVIKQQRTQLQNRRLTLRDRQKLRTYSNPEMDENDMEVEEFTRIGLTNSTQDKGLDNKNTTSASSASQSRVAEDSDACNDSVRSRTTSVADNAEGALNIQTIDNNSNVELSNDLKKQIPNERIQVHKESDKQEKDISSNHLRLRPRSQGPGVGRLKNLQQIGMVDNNNEPKQQISICNVRTPNLDLEVSSERTVSTSKNSNKNDITSNGKKSRVSRVDEFSGNLRKISNSSTRNEKDNSHIIGNRSNTPSKSSKQVNLGTFNKSKLNLERSRTIKQRNKNTPLTNLKVQLIKLETVCDRFEDYSASEIELLTRKYIDLLMNSNFTCDTWRNHINYHRSGGFTEKHIELVDNSDCVSDVESQEESEKVIKETETEDTINASRTKPVVEESIDQLQIKSAKQIETKLSSFTTLESAIATLVDAEPGDQINFGAVNISEALSNPSTSETEKEKEQTIQLNEDKANDETQEQVQINDKQQSIMSSDPILVNGTTMYPCSICNKIFIAENSLIQHQTFDHKDNAEVLGSASSTSTGTTTPKPSTKQKSQTASGSTSKKILKCKRKLRCSESLKCTICSVIFDTKELLFDHIMTHNEQELQEAYKTAKAKAKQQSEGSNSTSEESDKELSQEEVAPDNEANKKKKEKIKRKKSTDSSIQSSRSSMDTEDVVFDGPLRNPCTIPGPITVGEQQQQLIDLACNEILANVEQVPVGTLSSKPITICQCHVHETTAQDLQIEMILLCKICNVVFRRRDCFEVHYRTSSECRRRRTNNEITKMPKLFCSGCPCVLDSLMDMRAHLEMHARKNSQGTVTFICNICKVAFFGVGGIFYSHWFNHTKAPNFVASRYSFPKLSLVSILEDSNVAMTTSKSQEGFFYIAEHVCRQCRLPFSSEPELLKHKTHPCQPQQSVAPRVDAQESNRLQMIKLICDLCKKYYVSKENFDRHCSERNHLKTPITKFSRLPINANEQAFVCSLCRAVSKSLDDMKEHWKRIHSPIMELYTCKTCNIVPSNDVTNYTYEKFERHCRIVHKSEVITCLVYFVTARYVCNICRFGFETEKSMKEHQVVHQKRSSQGVSSNVTGSRLQMEPPASTLWMANKQLGVDVGRKVHPVYAHYPGINGNVNHPLPMLPTQAPMNVQNQTHNRNLGHINGNQINATSRNVVSNPNIASGSNNAHASISNGSAPNSMLRSMLAQKALDQQQPPQPINKNSNVETILIDSRSNSPSDSTVLNPRDKSASGNADTGVSSRKSYMTMVNPNFESLLGTNNSGRIEVSNNDSSLLDKEHLDSGGNATPVSMDLLTPQPFEVVLVTDDLSESSNCESLITNDRSRDTTNKMIDIANTVSNQQKHQTNECNGSSSTKSSKFLRVRSIAELQRMKINLCPICGLSFDTLQAFEQHSLQHELNGEINRMTPVQMISPMPVQGHKESNDPQSLLISQMRQKMALLTPNGKELQNSLDSRRKTNLSVLPNQFQHQQQQQQQQQQQHHSYWFASCNGRYNTNLSNMAYNTYNRHHHHQQQNHHQHQHQQHQNLHQHQHQQQQNHHQLQHQHQHQLQHQHQHQHQQQQQQQHRHQHQHQNHQHQQHHRQQQNEHQIHQSSLLRRPVNLSNVGSNYMSRGPPPPYPGTSSSMTPSRSSAIQLPERNTAGNTTPTTKRPSGAATRIPQQSLPSFSDVTEHRQTAVRMPYTSTENVNPRMLPNAAARHSQHPQYKNYSRHSGEFNYSNSIVNNYHHSQQQSKIIYNCKLQSCQFRSDNLSTLRAHEKNHLHQQLSTMPSNPMQQQQRLPIKHVPVSQMPERPRHAIPTSRQPTLPNIPDKRCICHICNLYCGSDTELVDHVSQCHNSANSQVCCYVCDYCPTPLIFDSEDLLRKHMNASHNHSCDLCSKRYPSKDDLMLHMEVHARDT